MNFWTIPLEMLSPLMWAAVISYPLYSFYLQVYKIFCLPWTLYVFVFFLLCVEHWQCVGDIILLFLWRQTANTCHIVWGHKCWLRNQFGYWNFSETFITLLPSIWEPIYLLDFIFSYWKTIVRISCEDKLTHVPAE